jgi:hypothetical protein
VGAAVEAGAEVVALTDHDTTAGLDEAAAAAAALGVRLIRGAEVAADWVGAEVHLLVLGLPAGWQVPEPLAAAHRLRVRRIEEWLALAPAVFPGFEADRVRPAWGPTVAPYAGVVLTGRLAEARRLGQLADRSWDVRSFAEAYFGPGGPLHVPEDPLPPLADAVRALDAGVTVLAQRRSGPPARQGTGRTAARSASRPGAASAPTAGPRRRRPRGAR